MIINNGHMGSDRRIKVIDLITILYILLTVSSVTCMIMTIIKSKDFVGYDIASWCILSIFGVICMLVCNMLLMFMPSEKLFRRIGRKKYSRRKNESKN